MNSFVFDIETGPLPESELNIPQFDPAEVKTGNIKDPAKIEAKIEEAKTNHERNAIANAALDPTTGRVLAVGIVGDKGTFVLDNDDEAALITEFWGFCVQENGRLNEIIGFNSNSFDLPFLVRRSWRHKIKPPPCLRRGRWWADQATDLREVWQMGDRMCKGSLDSIARFFGLPGKTISGADFHKLWATDRKQAIEYLVTDLSLTVKLAERMGVI